MLLDTGDTALVEEPGYPGAWGALTGAGVDLVSVPVDDEGLDIAAGERAAPNARLACVAPSHQYPLGVTMSLRRRLALLDWAERRGAWILEDDYDSEYRYAGRPLAAPSAGQRSALQPQAHIHGGRRDPASVNSSVRGALAASSAEV